MKGDSESTFPKAFGESCSDFLECFGGLIYTIICKKCSGGRIVIAANSEYIKVNLEPADIFQDFIVYIAKNGYKVLYNFKGINGAQPQTYLVKVTNLFISSQFNKETRRIKKEINDVELISDFSTKNDPLTDIIEDEKETFREESLESAYSRLKEKERLIVELFYGIRELEKISAPELAKLFRMKEKAIYKITEKFRKFFKDELKKRGIFDSG
ncbi:MAG: RNA polymerase sigma factor [bacterium]